MTRNLALIAWTVCLEFFRRKDIYVVMIMVLMFAGAVGVTRVIGIESASTANFLMSFGLTSSYLVAAVLAATLAARQLPREIECRTLHPLLAKPVSRAEVLLGKSLAVTALCSASLAAMITICYLAAPHAEEQKLAAFIQMIALQVISLGLLTLLTIAFSIYCAAPVAALASLGLFFGGATAIGLAERGLEEAAGAMAGMIARPLALVPDFSLFNQVQRFVEGGGALPPGSLAALVVYAAGLGFGVYLFAAWSFNRKAI